MGVCGSKKNRNVSEILGAIIDWLGISPKTYEINDLGIKGSENIKRFRIWNLSFEESWIEIGIRIKYWLEVIP